MKSMFFYDYPIGKVGIAEDNGAISDVFFSKPVNKKHNQRVEKKLAGFEQKETALIKKAAAQLFQYFEGKRKSFDFPLSFYGTDFQISVWKALQTIPFGETKTYKDIAIIVGNPKACRAVGMANNRNPIAIVVPCHRVIGHNGSLTGYAGGLDVKQFLLDLEKQHG